MFWNDIADLKEWAVTIVSRLTDLQMKMDSIIQEQEHRESFVKVPEDLERNLERLDVVLKISESSFDKVERYINNLEKYNGMINELKGCVSLARGAVLDRKEADSEQSLRVNQLIYHVETLVKDNCKIIDLFHKNIEKFAHFMQKQEKKPRKKRRYVKKKPVFPVL
jgi:hypothetical protein